MIPFGISQPATDRTALPPRSGFRRWFAPPMLSRGGARPSPWFSKALIAPRLMGATRRSSTSAILERPASTTANRPNPAHRTLGRPSAQLLIAGGFDEPLRERRGQPGGIGPGAARTDVTPIAWRPPKRSLASGGLAPTQIDPGTPCRGLVMPPAGVSPVASGARLYSTRLQRDRLRQGAEAPNRRADGIACASPPLQGRLSSPLAKENSIRRTRGAFHHRTSRHVSSGLGLLVHRLSPDCGNRGWPGRLFDRPARGGMTMPCPRAGRLGPALATDAR